MYGTGIDRNGEICDVAVEEGIIKKSGSWFSYGDRRLGQGREKVKELFVNEPEFADEITQKVMDALKSKEEAQAEEKADNGDFAAEERRPITQTRAAAKAKLDIAIEDDEDE